MGFIVQPALQKDYEAGMSRLMIDIRSLTWTQTFLSSSTACAVSIGAARRQQELMRPDLDLLYYVGHIQNDQSLIDIATQHADSIIHEILRPDFSSYHLVNFDPRSGRPQAKMTNQGWQDCSTWSRGQAWSIMGFAQTYSWTKDVKYLCTAMKCADYFLRRMREGEGKWHHHMIPVWDFDAPQDNPFEPLRDVSAGVIVANGFLIIHQSLQALSTTAAAEISGDINCLDVALQIISETLDMSYDQDLASFELPVKGMVNGDCGNGLKVNESGFECILRNSTTNWNPDAHKKYKNHGLVYADYYLLEFGNKLLRAGLL
jgi:hypothetical protein